MYICTYVYVHISMHAYMYRCLYVYVFVYISCIHVYMARMYTYMHIHMHVHIHIHTPLHIRAHVHMHIHIYVHIPTCTYTHTRTYECKGKHLYKLRIAETFSPGCHGECDLRAGPRGESELESQLPTGTLLSHLAQRPLQGCLVYVYAFKYSYIGICVQKHTRIYLCIQTNVWSPLPKSTCSSVNKYKCFYLP